MEIRLSGVVRESIVDGPGIRYSVFVQGCPHHCVGCHNPGTHAFSGGFVTTVDQIFSDVLKNPLLSGVTFSGGEPFCQAEPLCELADKVRDLGKNIVVYSGYTFEELINGQNAAWLALLERTDLLVDGRFELAQRDLTLKFRGSRNQRIIQVKEALKQRRPVEAFL